MSKRVNRHALLLASSGVLALAFSSLAYAASPEIYQFDIKGEPLSQALQKYSLETSRQIMFSEDIVRGQKAPVLQGRYTSDQALTALLDKTDLVASPDATGVIMIQRKKNDRAPAGGALILAQASPAQERPVTVAPSEKVEEVVVTGSHIVREGYEAPTPLAVVGAEQLGNAASGDISSVLSTLPVFSNNLAPNAGGVNSNPSAGVVGLNSINLRGLGPNRSLVLIDGQRVVPVLTLGTAATSAVDISNIPQQLIARIETVTGGASAVYGSDAVGGVTNFILDKKFTGVKGDISGGLTTYGDDANYRIALSAGLGFLNDRGHVILSGELYSKPQLGDSSNRKWNHNTYCVMNNPAYAAGNGQPFLLTEQSCGSTSAPGGVISSGPLRGTAFGPGGTPIPFHYGSLVATPLMVGGDYQLGASEHYARGSSLDPGESRQNVFGRVSYEIDDDTNVSYTYSWAHTGAEAQAVLQFNDRPANQINIQPDNAFIPVSIRPFVGATPFVLSTLNGDLGPGSVYNSRYVMRNVLSLDGKVNIFSSPWAWDINYVNGITWNSLNATTTSRSRYALAVDAVTNATGQVACRSAAANPSCVPYNVFGTGVNSAAALNYISTIGHVHQSNTQQVFSASITGEPVSLWAGPVSLALTAEHRTESARGVAGAGGLVNDNFFANYKPVNGHYSVTEGAIETLIPLAVNASWVDAWDLQLAARFTDYSTAGMVTTWKIGSTYSLGDVKLRGNISRDIRAANLGELFAQGAIQNIPGVLDPFTGSTAGFHGASNGNPNLKPEDADEFGLGVVYQPSFLPGLSTSVDYWSVHLTNTITSLTSQQDLLLCFQGNQAACSTITRSGPATLPGLAGTPYAGQFFAPLDLVIPTYANFGTSSTKGLDVAATYRFPVSDILPVGDGNLTLHWDQSFYFKGSAYPGIPGGFPSFTAPYWRGIGSVMYDEQRFSLGLIGRLASNNALTYATDPQTVECASGCPALSSLPGNVTTQNYIYRRSQFYLDTNFSYNLEVGGVDSQIYFNVRNILNTDPPLTPASGSSTLIFSINQSNVGDDALGRLYRLGIRFKM